MQTNMAHCNDARYAKECEENSDDRISFHEFPANEEQRKQWIVKIRRDPGPDFEVDSVM